MLSGMPDTSWQSTVFAVVHIGIHRCGIERFLVALLHMDGALRC